MTMTDIAGLLAATQKRLDDATTEIQGLSRSTEQKKNNYINAINEDKAVPAFKAFWEEAVAREKAAREALQALHAEEKALIEQLPTAGPAQQPDKLCLRRGLIIVFSMWTFQNAGQTVIIMSITSCCKSWKVSF